MAPFPRNINAAPEAQNVENMCLENHGTIEPPGSQTPPATLMSLQFLFFYNAF